MYTLAFRTKALKQWRALDPSVRRELLQVLEKRLLNPYEPSSRLRDDLSHCYKIKLRKAGVRLVYFPDGENFVVLVIAVGKRDGGEVYREASREILG